MSYRKQKLSSLGILNLQMNLTLTEKEARAFEINIDNYNNVEDLSAIFEDKSIINLVSLSSNSFLINTLLFINRAFKLKTQIEFITLNKLFFSTKNEFANNLIKTVTEKNNISIVQYPIIDIPSTINLSIEIIDDDKNVTQQKNFNLFEENYPPEEVNDKNSDYFNRLKHNFNCDFLFLYYNDVTSFIKKDSSEITYFLSSVLKKFPQIKIISYSSPTFEENSNKFIIEYSDIIFCDNDELLKKITNISKKRKHIQRILISLGGLKNIKVINQKGEDMNIVYSNKYKFTFNETENEDFINENNYNYYTGVFIGGYLSRLIYNKTFLTCFIAGKLITEKVINVEKFKMKNIIRTIGFYNVIVPMKKKGKKINSIQKIQNKPFSNTTITTQNSISHTESNKNNEKMDKNNFDLYLPHTLPPQKTYPHLKLVCKSYISMRNKLYNSNNQNNSSFHLNTQETYYCDKNSVLKKMKKKKPYNYPDTPNHQVMNNTIHSFFLKKRPPTMKCTLPTMYNTQQSFYTGNKTKISHKYNRTYNTFGYVNKNVFMTTINKFMEKANNIVKTCD